MRTKPNLILQLALIWLLSFTIGTIFFQSKNTFSNNDSSHSKEINKKCKQRIKTLPLPKLGKRSYFANLPEMTLLSQTTIEANTKQFVIGYKAFDYDDYLEKGLPNRQIIVLTISRSFLTQTSSSNPKCMLWRSNEDIIPILVNADYISISGLKSDHSMCTSVYHLIKSRAHFYSSRLKLAFFFSRQLASYTFSHILKKIVDVTLKC